MAGGLHRARCGPSAHFPSVRAAPLEPDHAPRDADAVRGRPPDAWPSGSVRGLCARGGFEVDIQWHSSKMVSAEIQSKAGEPCIVRYRGRTKELKTAKGKRYRLDADLSV